MTRNRIKKMLTSGLIVGIVLSILSYGGLFLAVNIKFFTPFFVEYLSGVFISDKSRDLFFYSHAMLISFALAFFWDRFKPVFHGHFIKRGLEFGLVYTITGLLPILWMTYSQIDVSETMVLSWLGFGMFQSSIAGIIFAKLNP
ncbi:MAG: hypothetical protein K2Q21_04355 [Chitinophagaceae bacterium]|nr:hypothetical protein [Chitinophagaceae bacterium]